MNYVLCAALKLSKQPRVPHSGVGQTCEVISTPVKQGLEGKQQPGPLEYVCATMHVSTHACCVLNWKHAYMCDANLIWECVCNCDHVSVCLPVCIFVVAYLCVCVPTNCACSEPGCKAWKHPLCVFLPVFDQADRRPLFRAGWLNLCDRVLLGRKIAFLRVRYTNDGLDQVFQHFLFHDLSKTNHWPR